jgi:peptidoglycan/xylan/chitin deacetylase (PgdA/CDA1 family)
MRFWVSVILAICFVGCGKDSQKSDVACLTIDDQITTTMLDILKKYDVKVTFFPVSSGVDREILARALAEGHEIGNHTSNSPRLKDLSFEDQKKEVELADVELGFVTKYLRPPHGEYNEDTKRLGKTVVIWNFNADIDTPLSAGIILLHKEERLEQVIIAARSSGLRLLSLENCIKNP